MKKFLAFSAFIFIISFYAIHPYAMSKSDIKSMLEENYSFPNGINDTAIDAIYNYWNMNQEYYLVTKQSNTSYVNVFICESYVYDTALRVTNYYDFWVYFSDGRVNNSTPTFQQRQSAQGSGDYTVNVWTDSSIDFDTLYYSAQIPVPSIDVYMGSEINNPTSGQAVWNASIEFGDNSQYYIQYGYKASFPSYIDVGLASLRGDYSYNYYNYTSTGYIDIVGMNSLTQAVNQSKSAAYFQDAWQSFYDNYLTQSLLPEFGTQVNAMSTAMIDDAKDYYIDYMLGQIPMYGNRLEIFARYFIIDEENNNRVVVGAWNHWNSKDGSRTKERPSNYIDNVALPGNIITNNDPEYQDNSDTYTSNGDNTGTPATIINNNYAPNYPDYPTVVTYNHDNILLNFMDTAKQLPSFFGEFTSFLTVAFGFIPSWIWTIIGMGFTFSIVIMIIKVL